MNIVPTQPDIRNVMGLLFRRNNGAEFEADLSPLSSVNFNNEWKCTSTPHTHVHGVIPYRHRGILSYLLLHTVYLDWNY